MAVRLNQLQREELGLIEQVGNRACCAWLGSATAHDCTDELNHTILR